MSEENPVSVTLEKDGDVAVIIVNNPPVNALNERALGPDHPELAFPLTNLGIVLREQGEPAEVRIAAGKMVLDDVVNHAASDKAPASASAAIPLAAAVNWVLVQRAGRGPDLSMAVLIGGSLSALLVRHAWVAF